MPGNGVKFVFQAQAPGLARRIPTGLTAQMREAPYEVWLVTHRDLRHTARIRATIDEIVSAFDTHR